MRLAWRQLWLSIQRGNGAAAPTPVTAGQKIWRGNAACNASGVATFQITTTGLVGGDAIFTDLTQATIIATPKRNVSAAWQVQYAQIKSVDAKTVTINVVGNGSFASTDTSVDLIVIGN